MSGPEVSRPHIEAAKPEHPSLLDPTHQLDSLFGVVNIPAVTWIDEEGVIVRPPEPGWPHDPAALRPAPAPGQGQQRTLTPEEEEQARARRELMAKINSGQDRGSYADAIRDWVANGPASPFVLTPDEVIEKSHPRSPDVSRAAAHFELANHLWRHGRREPAIEHFNAAHRLQPENWTYKRQAWSLIGNERVGGDRGRFAQSPQPGEEADWPFESDFVSDVNALEPGQYYPKTL